MKNRKPILTALILVMCVLTPLCLCACADDEDIIYFGRYPQSEVTDSTLKSSLTDLAGALPTSSDSRNWTSYGYYISGSVSNFMWYIDIGNDKEKYRGVYFTSYRPSSTKGKSSVDSSSQDDNGYYTSTVYWFKYEPIKWQILTESNGKALLLADIALDSQEYYITGREDGPRTVGDETIYANNYAYSTIREWLNDTFYNRAFNDLEKERILTTIVDNSVSSTGYSPNSYACSNTIDKVFLLSYVEATTYLTRDSARRRQRTDYAMSQGLSKGYLNYYPLSSYIARNCCNWWLRSPRNGAGDTARNLARDGAVSDNDATGVFVTCNGVVPALWIAMEK